MDRNLNQEIEKVVMKAVWLELEGYNTLILMIEAKYVEIRGEEKKKPERTLNPLKKAGER